MRLDAMNSADKAEPRPLPPVDLRRWAGQTVSSSDPYEKHEKKDPIGFRGAPKNLRDDKD